VSVRLAVVIALAGLAACANRNQPATASRAPATAAPLACPVTTAATLTVGIEVRPGCAHSDPACEVACRSGDPHACYWHGIALEATEKRGASGSDARRYFHRACELGHAGGCTNYAATLWAVDATPPNLACAEALFTRTCLAGEMFACGMEARVVLEREPAPDTATIARARSRLERSCDELEGFPCRILAVHLENGTFGSHDPAQIPALLTRACNGGDVNACGNPPSAAATLH
jgi:TPR repeat protein